jgi:hypothetical protein
MPIDNINTSAIQLFLQQVKGADLSNQREIRMDMASAKNLAYTLGIVMTRLAGNYESLLQQQKETETTLEVKMDGGNWDN